MNGCRIQQMSVDAIMRRWPDTVAIFVQRRFLCVGCPAAAFHSVDEAIREHHADGDAFRKELGAVIDRKP